MKKNPDTEKQSSENSQDCTSWTFCVLFKIKFNHDIQKQQLNHFFNTSKTKVMF